MTLKAEYPKTIGNNLRNEFVVQGLQKEMTCQALLKAGRDIVPYGLNGPKTQ